MTVPDEMPVAMPVPAATVAMDGLALLHVPPGIALLSKALVPTQTVPALVIAGGRAMTEMTVVVGQPPKVYVQMADPPVRPTTEPDVAPIDIVEEELLHVPPLALARVIELPTHTDAGPVIGGGSGFTVTDLLTEQPVVLLKEYVTTAIPAVPPVKIPDIGLIDAPAELPPPTLQTPPGVVLVNRVVIPAQTLPTPVIVAGSGLTVTTVIAKHPAGL